LKDKLDPYTSMRAYLASVVLLLLHLGLAAAQAECGKPAIAAKSTSRILNGEEAVPHSYPWMVSIEGQIDPHYCGAALVSPRWVLTAAHCAKLVFIGSFFSDQVALGQHDRDNENEPGKEKIEIEEVFIHPNYEKPGSPKKSFDIALLKLKSEATLTDTVKTVCLPDLGDFGDSSSFPAGMECVLTGWGTTPGEHHPSDIYGQPYKLRMANLPLVDDASCEKIYLEGADFEIQETMQCAGGSGKTSCVGDSGSPLVCQKGDQWYQVGVVSFGPSPCDAEIPAVYTRVAAYTDWIEETIAKNGGH